MPVVALKASSPMRPQFMAQGLPGPRERVWMVQLGPWRASKVGSVKPCWPRVMVWGPGDLLVPSDLGGRLQTYLVLGLLGMLD